MDRGAERGEGQVGRDSESIVGGRQALAGIGLEKDGEVVEGHLHAPVDGVQHKAVAHAVGPLDRRGIREDFQFDAVAAGEKGGDGTGGVLVELEVVVAPRQGQLAYEAGVAQALVHHLEGDGGGRGAVAAQKIEVVVTVLPRVEDVDAVARDAHGLGVEHQVQAGVGVALAAGLVPLVDVVVVSPAAVVGGLGHVDPLGGIVAEGAEEIEPLPQMHAVDALEAGAGVGMEGEAVEERLSAQFVEPVHPVMLLEAAAAAAEEIGLRVAGLDRRVDGFEQAVEIGLRRHAQVGLVRRLPHADAERAGDGGPLAQPAGACLGAALLPGAVGIGWRRGGGIVAVLEGNRGGVRRNLGRRGLARAEALAEGVVHLLAALPLHEHHDRAERAAPAEGHLPLKLGAIAFPVDVLGVGLVAVARPDALDGVGAPDTAKAEQIVPVEFFVERTVVGQQIVLEAAAAELEGNVAPHAGDIDAAEPGTGVGVPQRPLGRHEVDRDFAGLVRPQVEVGLAGAQRLLDMIHERPLQPVAARCSGRLESERVADRLAGGKKAVRAGGLAGEGGNGGQRQRRDGWRPEAQREMALLLGIGNDDHAPCQIRPCCVRKRAQAAGRVDTANAAQFHHGTIGGEQGHIRPVVAELVAEGEGMELPDAPRRQGIVDAGQQVADARHRAAQSEEEGVGLRLLLGIARLLLLEAQQGDLDRRRLEVEAHPGQIGQFQRGHRRGLGIQQGVHVAPQGRAFAQLDGRLPHSCALTLREHPAAQQQPAAVDEPLPAAGDLQLAIGEDRGLVGLCLNRPARLPGFVQGEHEQIRLADRDTLAARQPSRHRQHTPEDHGFGFHHISLLEVLSLGKPSLIPLRSAN